MKIRTPAPRLGLFAIGLEAYWPQFPGLKERLAGYHQEIQRRLQAFGCEVIEAGLVDTAFKAEAAGDLFARSDLDLMVCHAATYATSSQVLTAVQRARLPALILNLQPAPALDYATADTFEWLAHCSACCVPEISCALARARLPFQVVSGLLRGHEEGWREIEEWCAAAGAARRVRRAHIGFLGYTYPGMLDLYSDFTLLAARLGIHIEVLEMGDLAARVESAGGEAIEKKIEEARAIFEIDASVDPAGLEWAARVAVGLDRLVEDFRLQGLAYYYRGLEDNLDARLGAGLILGNSLLTGQGVPASGEGDLKNCVAMLAMDSLGAGGSYTEFYAMDFNDNFLLMGHDGPGHLAISDRRPILRGLDLYHGKRGHGVSVEFNVKTGPITVLGLTQRADGELRFLAAEGESIPGPILRIGNTNSRLRFSLGPARFVNDWCQHGPTHHCALGVGHQMPRLEKLARLLGVELVKVDSRG
ncbi:MAG: L-fucose/L-arabinose isomerase family protein [Planctomycetes bacterium]|nr:L-fucose/L-arabinose isomerase family protein [Planctomycetota bacterium]